MKISPQAGRKFGVIVEGFDAETASPQEIVELKKAIYTNKIAVLKNQDLSPRQFLALGERLGRVSEYYEPVYHHPEVKEVFVSSNVKEEDGRQIGVPKTGKFWHSDYQFMPRPFDITMIYPQVVPSKNRGTYFINMATAYEKLSEELKLAAKDTTATHSVLRYFKIRPTDVYRPISEIIDEVNAKTPPVTSPLAFAHPHTDETVLYVSEGFTLSLQDADGNDRSELLTELLTATGQLDRTYEHENIHLQTFEKGDMLLWDNRSLIHRALHTATPEPAVSYRVTVYDDVDTAA
ncbi:TauD/TfdA family dioxygenase [Micromonospora peucetia]|uniref:TauD/TfdA family dioxygenase n=1 Tax=Micromonospora peucetia TaxID=47871 RepID=A0A1C6U8T9_9ACTN|nr:TauD/TfdA family dioxygenase [Micromonospora peucetia]MCX4386292.1 TauD/TfdA family dioxygenase [Micromonospora peucetia]WSA33634.1 TauD/TfdA family dioxygenase [Micromonospora peucetia]SCL50437.1 taurine dioxygenase [Micromonospora peucetia]